MIKEFCDCCGREISEKHILDNKVICNSCFGRVSRCLNSESDEMIQNELDSLKEENDSLRKELFTCKDKLIHQYAYQETAMRFIQLFNNYIDEIKEDIKRRLTLKTEIKGSLFGSYVVQRMKDESDYAKRLDSYKIIFSYFDEYYNKSVRCNSDMFL